MGVITNNISVLYTHTFYMYKVASDAPHGRNRARDRRGCMYFCASDSRHPIDQLTSGIGEVATAPPQSFWVVSETQYWSSSARRRLRLTHAADPSYVRLAFDSI
jgi:hypothetical protein